MKKFLLLAFGMVALAGCSKKEEATPPPVADSAIANPVQTAPGAPADANKPLTDGRVDKASETGPGGPSVGGK